MATTSLARLVPALACCAALEAGAATFAVNSTLDVVDATPGNGVCETTTGGGTCTLRAAILEANALAGADIVSLPAGTYTIATGLSSGSDTPAIADFDVTGDLQIDGAGSQTTIIEGNWAVADEDQDRAFQVVAGVDVTISGVTIWRAVTYYAAGGAIANAGTLELSDCVVRDSGTNSYPLPIPGGGIHNTGTLTIRRCEIADNSTWGDGGGVANEGTLVVEDSLLDGNTGSSGGGIANSGTLTVRNSTLAANRARGTFNSSLTGGEGAGAGILDAGGTALLEHTTVSGNIVGPGGIIPINQVPDYYGTGAGLGEPNGMATSGVSLRSSVIAGNVHDAAGATDNDCGTPAPTSLGHNLDGDGTCMLTGTGDLPATDPLLGPLADNGGPTRTMALPAGSPAIDAADPGACLAADQRGAPRPSGACDIGAYENTLPCGDGDVDPGEQCDDGSPASGDCCSFLCQYHPANTACDVEGDPCTDDRCDGAGVCALSATIDCAPCETCANLACVPGPRALCRDPVVDGRSTLVLEPDRLVWRWTKGEATSSGDFGDPAGGDDYGFCLFDDDPYDWADWRLRLDAQLPGGATCGGGPCWKALGQPPGSRGSFYRDREETQSGVASVRLRPGDDGQSRIIVKGKGPGLGLDPLDFYVPLRVQLQRRGGACWEAHFTQYDKFRYPDFYKFRSAPAP